MATEEVARTLAAMERMEAVNLTEKEQITWEAERQSRREREKAEFPNHADKLRKLWE